MIVTRGLGLGPNKGIIVAFGLGITIPSDGDDTGSGNQTGKRHYWKWGPAGQDVTTDGDISLSLGDLGEQVGEVTVDGKTVTSGPEMTPAQVKAEMAEAIKAEIPKAVVDAVKKELAVSAKEARKQLKARMKKTLEARQSAKRKFEEALLVILIAASDDDD